MNRLVSCILLLAVLAACGPVPAIDTTAGSSPSLPNFEHIVTIIFENKGFETVIGNPLMPNYNKLAKDYTLLTQYYAIGHPSLPNYLALLGGDTFGIDKDCTDCFVNAPSLPELIQASGRTWKTYQEDMPSPCFVGNQGEYAQKHNPFVYFDPIRLNRIDCEKNVVPLTELKTDLKSGALPNFAFITPNLCNDAHSCSLDTADKWLGNMIQTLTPALEQTGQPYLVVIMFDEAHKPTVLQRLIVPGGGRVPVVLYSPDVKKGFEDSTFYNHYSLLKTISAAWGLSYLRHAADNSTLVIRAPWK
jgi:phospholipase C